MFLTKSVFPIRAIRLPRRSVGAKAGVIRGQKSFFSAVWVLRDLGFAPIESSVKPPDMLTLDRTCNR